MAVKIDTGDDNPPADPCCMAGKVVCGISASLFGMDFLSAGQCAIGNGDSFVPHQSQGMEALQMLIGGFVIFMIPQVVGGVVVLLELAAVMLRQVWYI